MSRWNHYGLVDDGRFDHFWAARRKRAGKTILIVGDGFDPRAPTAPARIIGGGARTFEVLRLGLRRSELPHDEREAVAANRDAIDALARDADVTVHDYPYPEIKDPKSAGAVVIRTLLAGNRFEDADELIVDVSALPLDVYFAVVSGVVRAAPERWDGDLFVVGTDNPELDDAIVHEGAEGLAPLPGFSGGGAPTDNDLRVWVPILGKGRSDEALHVYRQTFEQRPDEICPVLPFPSTDPRRADDIVLDHRGFLFDEVEIDVRNFIYASEWNPFDLYRQLGLLYDRYRALVGQVLGEPAITISCHGSKLLSVGALLAAHEHRFAVLHTTPSGYYLRAGVDPKTLRTSDRLFCAWVHGEPYRTT